MSPEQLAKLSKLSALFEEGIATKEQLKQLSEILEQLNLNQEKSNKTLINCSSN